MKEIPLLHTDSIRELNVLGNNIPFDLIVNICSNDATENNAELHLNCEDLASIEVDDSQNSLMIKITPTNRYTEYQRKIQDEFLNSVSGGLKSIFGFISSIDKNNNNIQLYLNININKIDKIILNAKNIKLNINSTLVETLKLDSKNINLTITNSDIDNILCCSKNISSNITPKQSLGIVNMNSKNIEFNIAVVNMMSDSTFVVDYKQIKSNVDLATFKGNKQIYLQSKNINVKIT